MFEFIRNHQMNIMLFLCATSVTMAILLAITRFLPKKRKYILVGMEIIATLLLGFDRFAYIYSGDSSALGYVMVRLSNFMVFFMTSAVVFCFNLYLADLISSKSISAWGSKRLKFAGLASIIGMLLAIVTVFTGLYYTFDEQNHYQRGTGFLIAYIIPVLCPLIQFTVIYKYRKEFSRFIYTALVLYIFIPITVGIIQIFTYGISIVNMAMVLVSVSLYIFTYLDINNEVQRIHNMEMETLKEEQENMKKLFAQTTSSFVSSIERRNKLLEGISEKTANTALKIAKACGKDEDDCGRAYYAGLLHNAGIGSLSDDLVGKIGNLTEDEEKIIQNLPVVSGEILSKISAFPELSENVRHINERYDGKGWPDGLTENEIPEISRIVAVAKEYTLMTSKTKDRNPLPKAIVREEFVKEGGQKFDPNFASTLVHLMDVETNENPENDAPSLETKLSCTNYRENVSSSIPILQNFTEVSFKFTPTAQENGFSVPSIILFDSFDKKVHEDQKSIDAYHYMEYGEIWFDGHIISTSARNMEISTSEKEIPDADESLCKISVARYEDHILLKAETSSKVSEVIAALPDISKAAYISLTGENCLLSDIKMEVKEEKLEESSIERIAERISYINHLESDIPNIQINNPRECYTQGVEIKERMRLCFHTMSLPEANLVWHCPYIVLYYSEDGEIGGKNYREYAFIKINGEDNGSNSFAENNFRMKRTDSFKNWSKWKEENKAGFECRIDFSKKGNKITLSTENLGISIENTTKILESKDEVYAALTGDQCAITDIRII